MKAFIINPCVKKFGVFEKYVPDNLPLSIGFVAGYLEMKGIKSELIDEQLGQLTDEDIHKHFFGIGKCLVGVSCLTATAHRAYLLAEKIKKVNAKAVIVMGGVHPTVLPEESFYEDYIDIAVHSEGEDTFHELYEKIKNDEDFRTVRGISYKENGKIIRTDPRPLIPDLNTLPPFPYHLFEHNIDRYNFGQILTSRGCPYACIFCSQRSISGIKYRYRSPENVVKELDTLIYKYKQRMITFNDDIFTIHRKHTVAVCEAIIAANFPKDVKIIIMTRADALDEELLKLLKQAGIYQISFGLETGSDRVMKYIKKNESIEDIRVGVTLTAKAGIKTMGSFILGFPTETKEEMQQTIRFAKSLPLDAMRFNLLVPYPGTYVYEVVKRDKRYQQTLKRGDWSNHVTVVGFGDDELPYIPEGITDKELRRLQIWGNVSFYLRPKAFVTFIRNGFKNQLHLPSLFSLEGLKAYSKIGSSLIGSLLKTFSFFASFSKRMSH